MEHLKLTSSSFSKSATRAQFLPFSKWIFFFSVFSELFFNSECLFFFLLLLLNYSKWNSKIAHFLCEIRRVRFMLWTYSILRYLCYIIYDKSKIFRDSYALLKDLVSYLQFSLILYIFRPYLCHIFAPKKKFWPFEDTR